MPRDSAPGGFVCQRTPTPIHQHHTSGAKEVKSPPRRWASARRNNSPDTTTPHPSPTLSNPRAARFRASGFAVPGATPTQHRYEPPPTGGSTPRKPDTSCMTHPFTTPVPAVNCQLSTADCHPSLPSADGPGRARERIEVGLQPAQEAVRARGWPVCVLREVVGKSGPFPAQRRASGLRLRGPRVNGRGRAGVVLSPPHMHGRAGPRIAPWLPHHLRADGVLLDVVHRLAVVRLVQRAGVEAPLPEMPAALVKLVDIPPVAPVPSPKVRRRRIRHQAVAVGPQPVPPLGRRSAEGGLPRSVIWCGCPATTMRASLGMGKDYSADPWIYQE